ncbi:site-specific tyrosine recombinase XerD [Humidisolicoccus flavus]|uniref:site-specific tyrosine recombinase XerD n=1 Tax=Humidisolicoccus flavus TaxID=3111414 RepID=UPI003250CFAF
MTPAEALRRYLRHVTVERGLSAHTLAAYERDLGAYLLVLERAGVTSVAEIESQHCRAFRAALADRALKPTSIARHISAMRGFHRFMLGEGLTDEDPSVDVAAPKLPSRLPKAITVAQMTTLIDAARGEEPLELRDHALLEMLYATGARVSEIVQLDVDDVIEGDTVRVTGKGKKQRLVPVGSFARKALDAYLVRARPILAAKTGGPALFLGARGARLSRQSAWLVIQAIADRAELSAHISPHTFRHSFATHLIEGGADVRVVQELLGHSSVATTQIYTLLTADSLRDMYRESHPRAQRATADATPTED